MKALAVAGFVALGAAPVSAAPIDYDEALDGSLPRSPAPNAHTPESALALDAGTNVIRGTAQWGGPGGSSFDSILLELTDELAIDSITLSADKVDGAAILDVIRAELFTYNSAVTSNSSVQFELLAVPLGVTNLYTANLPVAEAGFYGVSISGFSGNLDGSFALVDYTWNIVVTPEPGTATLLGAGLIGLSLRRRGAPH